ncbi:uncharacterized protein C4orf50 homolog [Molossus nigricans]
MEPTAQGHSEKTFSYVVRAPSSDGFDVMNVDVKIDTSWVFQDVDDSGEEQARVPGAGGRRSPDMDAGTLGRQLESSEQKLLAAVDKYVMSESGLRSRIQELELSERKLLRKVDQLRARVCQERSTSLRAQEQLEALQGELASQVLEKERAARRQRWRLQRLREQLRHKDEALGQQTAALERVRRTQRRELGLVREQERVLRAQVQRLERDVRRLCRAAGLLLAELDAPTRGSPRSPGPAGPQGAPVEAAEVRALRERAERAERERDEAARRLREHRAAQRQLRVQLEELRCWIYELKLSEISLQSRVEDLAEQNRSLREGLAAAPAEPSLHEQTLLLLCGCPSGPCPDGSLLPVELAWVSEQRLAAAPAQASFLVQASMLPPWGPAGDRAPLLLQEASPEELQIQWVLGAGPLPALGAIGQPCGVQHQTRSRNASLGQGSLQILHHLGSRGLDGPWEEGGGAPEWRPTAWGARRTWGREGEDLGDRCQRHQKSRQESLGEDVDILEGLQDKLGASESPATAFCPCLRQERPLPLLGEASMCTEGPQSLSGTRQAEEHVWGLLGGPSSAEEEAAAPATFFRAHGAKGPSPAGAQRPAEQDRATRRVQGQGGDHVWPANTALWLEGSPGEGGTGDEEQGLGGSSLGSKEWQAKETLLSVEEGGLPLPPRLAFSPEGAEPPSPSRAPRKGQDRSALTIDAFAAEMEACFRQLSLLAPGIGGRAWEACTWAAEVGSFAARWTSGQEHVDPQQVAANQGLDTCPAKEAHPQESRGGVKPGETEALGTGHVLPGMGPGLEDLRLGPGGPSERGQSLCQPSRALERARSRLHQLVSGLKKERSRVLHDNLQLQRDQERCHKKIRALQTERERNVNKICALERDNSALSGDLSHLKSELDQYRQVIADLEDCNGKSYSRISALEEENGQLRRGLGQLQKAMSESTRRCKGLAQGVTQENRELRALISELGVSYKELVKDVVLGIEDMIGALRGENAHLLRRISVLEREVALGMSTDGGRFGGAEERLPGQSKEAVGKADAVERAVPMTPLPEHLTMGDHGPPSEKEPGLAGGRTGPSSGTENPRCGTESAAPSLAGRSADVSGALPADGGGMAVQEAHLDKEEDAPWCSADQGGALRPLSSGPQVGCLCIAASSPLANFLGCWPPPLPALQQPWEGRAATASTDQMRTHRHRELQDPAAETSEEDLRLRVGQLRHQVLTLQCQLRDQGSAGRELQAALGAALRLRDQLQGKVDELQKKQREANLAVTPLKAKLASLVQKCRDRNHLLMHLLQELCRHGAASHLLSETVHSMVADVALAEYATTFLAPGLPETSRHLDGEPERTAAAGAQEYLLNPEMDSVLPRPRHSESWPVTEAEWPAQTARLDSLELPLPLGPTPDPGPGPAAATVVSGLPAPRLQAEGGPSGAAHPAEGLPPPSELRSPARILAFHAELRQTVCSNPQVNKSPLEL